MFNRADDLITASLGPPNAAHALTLDVGSSASITTPVFPHTLYRVIGTTNLYLRPATTHAAAVATAVDPYFVSGVDYLFNTQQNSHLGIIGSGTGKISLCPIEDPNFATRVAVKVLDTAEVATGWTGIGAATANVDASTTSKIGTYSISFDKANHASITTAGVYKAITAVNIAEYRYVGCYYRVSALTDIATANSFRLLVGSSGSDYFYQYVAKANATAAVWNLICVDLQNPGGVTGAPDRTAVDYVSFQVDFTAAAGTLAEILADQFFLWK